MKRKLTKEQRKRMSEATKRSWITRRANMQAPVIKPAVNNGHSTGLEVLDSIVSSLATLTAAPENLEQAQMVIGAMDMAKKYLLLKFKPEDL